MKSVVFWIYREEEFVHLCLEQSHHCHRHHNQGKGKCRLTITFIDIIRVNHLLGECRGLVPSRESSFAPWDLEWQGGAPPLRV